MALAYLPVVESFGLEMPENVTFEFAFDHWETMSGGEFPFHRLMIN